MMPASLVLLSKDVQQILTIERKRCYYMTWLEIEDVIVQNHKVDKGYFVTKCILNYNHYLVEISKQ